MNRIAYVLPDDDNDEKQNRSSMSRRICRSTVNVFTMLIGFVTLCALCLVLYLALNQDKVPYFRTKITVALAKITGKSPDEIEELRRQAAKKTSIYLPYTEVATPDNLEPPAKEDVALVQIGQMPREIVALKSMAKLSNAQINNAIKLVVESEKHDLDPLFILAIAYSDSRLKEDAVNLDGIGLIGIKPDEATEIARLKGIEYSNQEELKDIDKNLAITLANLADLKKLFHGKEELMLYGKYMGKKKFLNVLANNTDLPDPASRYAQRVLINYGELQNRMEKFF